MLFKITNLLNLILLTCLMILIGGFQTTFWYQVFGSVMPPLIWLNVIVYLILYRRPFPTIFIIYFFGLILSTFTAMPLSMMWTSLLIFFVMIYFFKSRVFWGGAGYFTMMCTGGAVLYHLIYFGLSLFFEHIPTHPEPIDRLVQILITPIFSFPVYQIIKTIDRWTMDPIEREIGGFE